MPFRVTIVRAEIRGFCSITVKSGNVGNPDKNKHSPAALAVPVR